VFYFLSVNYYSTNLLAKLINSLESSQDKDYILVIINNSPEDDSIYKLKTESILILESGDNIGFANACNLGLKFIYNQCPEALVWIINPDA
jgi:N-acetylglucosaminyl-diphospho-decaprenol L-rhamnosyltransferase